MPRKARIDVPGAVYHIMARGVEERKIFRNDGDREDFTGRLDLILNDTGTPCYAWAVMPNHFHLLLRAGSVSIATVMRRLLSGYAQSFNRRHHRHGHLFQDRYKSILCQEDTYLLELVRYIHLNPIRSRIVPDLSRLDAYGFCGHGVLLGKRQVGFQHTDKVLKRFAGTIEEARTRYGDFVKKGLTQGRRRELSGGGLVRSAGGWAAVKMLRKSKRVQQSDDRILGDGDFVKSVLGRIGERLEHTYSLKAKGCSFSKIVQRVAGLLDLPIEKVKSAGKQRDIVKARSMVCYWAHKELGLSQMELAGAFGVSQPAVCAAVQKGQKIIKNNQFELY